ncbi:hypothetical protein EG68_08109 [Paragonimus skrjabini miyazakii]|uniref:RRM domain-containing protein n=1 Tax=Paragonimus skrjabini miyazakii TaxID=59628 RepID=A0A8S9YJG1_9TREM|nr:hypothetical protein EG68_08109 [Paragonimus skrjabini miyazakii]
MLSFDSSLMNVYRQAMMSFPTSSPSDAILFGKNIRYQPFVLLTLTEDQRFAIDRAKKYALEQSIQNALSKQAAQLHQQDLNTIKRNQALILLSRIYVGSISFEVGEDDIRKTFSPFGPIKSVALSWDSTLQKHKGFAFIEFEVPEAASLALEQMNGYTLAGRNLKASCFHTCCIFTSRFMCTDYCGSSACVYVRLQVGRPSNAPQTGNLEAELRADESTRYRVYVASVHPELTESDIQTVFEAFGKVKSCTLYPDPKSPGRHRGFGYIEFESEEAVIAAVSSMNCFDLAGQQLRVGRAIIPKDSPLPFEAATAKPNSTSAAATQASVSAVALAAASISAQVMSMSAEEASAAAAVPDGTAATSRRTNQSSGFGEPPAVVANLPPPGVFIPTVVGATNVSTTEPSHAEEVVSATTASMWDDDDDSLMPSAPADAEVVTFDDNPPSESSSFSPGSLSRVMLLENMVSVDEVDEDLKAEVAEECANYGDVLQVHVHVIGDTDVRIFVQFDRSDAARTACDALNQRFFAGRVVRAKLFDEERFQLHQFDD